MPHHTVIEMFSPLWWKCLSVTLIAGTVLIIAGKKIPWLRETIRITSGIFLLWLAVALHLYLAWEGRWNLQSSLPLQLCSLSGILSGIALLWPGQFIYELLLYWGIPGTFYSLLTPEMTQGSGGPFLYEYYLSHGGIIFSALYLSIAYKMSPRRYSWLKIFLLTQLLLPIVGMADYFFSANYMYLKEKPVVSNPFVIGDWPWYILGLDVALLLHLIITYLPFHFIKRHK